MSAVIKKTQLKKPMNYLFLDQKDYQELKIGQDSSDTSLTNHKGQKIEYDQIGFLAGMQIDIYALGFLRITTTWNDKGQITINGLNKLTDNVKALVIEAYIYQVQYLISNIRLEETHSEIDYSFQGVSYKIPIIDYKNPENMLCGTSLALLKLSGIKKRAIAFVDGKIKKVELKNYKVSVVDGFFADVDENQTPKFRLSKVFYQPVLDNQKEIATIKTKIAEFRTDGFVSQDDFTTDKQSQDATILSNTNLITTLQQRLETQKTTLQNSINTLLKRVEINHYEADESQLTTDIKVKVDTNLDTPTEWANENMLLTLNKTKKNLTKFYVYSLDAVIGTTAPLFSKDIVVKDSNKKLLSSYTLKKQSFYFVDYDKDSDKIILTVPLEGSSIATTALQKQLTALSKTVDGLTKATTGLSYDPKTKINTFSQKVKHLQDLIIGQNLILNQTLKATDNVGNVYDVISFYKATANALANAVIRIKEIKFPNLADKTKIKPSMIETGNIKTDTLQVGPFSVLPLLTNLNQNQAISTFRLNELSLQTFYQYYNDLVASLKVDKEAISLDQAYLFYYDATNKLKSSSFVLQGTKIKINLSPAHLIMPKLKIVKELSAMVKEIDVGQLHNGGYGLYLDINIINSVATTALRWVKIKTSQGADIETHWKNGAPFGGFWTNTLTSAKVLIGEFGISNMVVSIFTEILTHIKEVEHKELAPPSSGDGFTYANVSNPEYEYNSWHQTIPQDTFSASQLADMKKAYNKALTNDNYALVIQLQFSQMYRVVMFSQFMQPIYIPKSMLKFFPTSNISMYIEGHNSDARFKLYTTFGKIFSTGTIQSDYLFRITYFDGKKHTTTYDNRLFGIKYKVIDQSNGQVINHKS